MTNPVEYCHNCGAAITEPSSFCGNCGAAVAAAQTRPSGSSSTPPHSPGAASPPPAAMSTQPPARPTATGGDAAPRRAWLPFAAVGGAVAVLAAIVAVLLLTLGGSAGKNVRNASATRQQALALLAANGTTTVSSSAPGLYAEVNAGRIAAVVPAGWRATSQATGATGRAEFADPGHAGSTLTVVSEGSSAGGDHARAEAAAKALRQQAVTVSGYGPVEFPGGRRVWHVLYSKQGVTHATYFFTACGGKQAMTVDTAASVGSYEREQGKLRAAAAGAEPLC